MTRLILPILCLALGTACVGKKKYDAALAESESLSEQVESLSAELADMSEEVIDLESELAATEAALEETNGKLAEKIAEAGELAEDMERMKTALTELETRKAKADAALEEFRSLVERFQALIDAGTLEVKVIDGRMVVELATDILFPPGSATLSRDGRRAIEEVAAVLADIEGREYQVVGHTDSQPIATERFPSNWHLGAARAISVVELLVNADLGAERVSAASFAEFQPVSTNRTPAGRAENRRIEIIVVPDLSTLPGYEELEALARGEEPDEE